MNTAELRLNSYDYIQKVRYEKKNELKSITLHSWILKLRYSDSECIALKTYVSQGLSPVSYTSAKATVRAAFHSKQGL